MDDYRREGDSIIATHTYKVKRFFARFPELFRGKDFTLATLKDVVSQLEGKVTSKYLIVKYEKDLMRYVVTALMMMTGYKPIKIMNAYNLIDVLVGNSEEYSCISDIEGDIICVYLGYSEMENKRQSDVIEQLLEKQVMSGKSFWLLYKGNDFNSKYSRVQNLVTEIKGNIIQIRSGVCGTNNQDVDFF